MTRAAWKTCVDGRAGVRQRLVTCPIARAPTYPHPDKEKSNGLVRAKQASS